MRSPKTTAVITGVALTAVLAGCGTSTDTASTPSTAPSTVATTSAPTPTPTPTPTPSESACEPASDGVKAAIEEGLDESWGLKVGRTAIVPDTTNNVYYAAAELNFPDGATDVAVWETSADDGTGYMHSADAMAESFSNYPQKYADAATPGVKEAKACLE